MTEDSSHPDTQDEPSVFGNLPRTRPGARSPRRDQAAAARDRAEAKREQVSEAPSPEDDAERILAGSRPAAREQEGPADASPDGGEDDRGGLEELAWAGVAAAAEAATLGVRLANRAMESLRGGSEES
jgi:hypothetical protein